MIAEVVEATAPKSDALRRVLPHSREAEEACVGGVIFGGAKAIEKVCAIVDTEDFYHAPLQLVYQAALAVHQAGVPVDLITVSKELTDRDQMKLLLFQESPGSSFLAALANAVSTVDNIEYHARIVRNCAVKRQLIHQQTKLLDRIYFEPDTEALLRQVQEMLNEADQRLPRQRVPLFDIELFNKESLDSFTRPIPPKLPFGIPQLDEALLDGFAAGAVIVLGAPPKHMKTALLIHLMIHWAHMGERVVYITAENSAKEIYARMSAHQQFNVTNKFHSTIKHAPAKDAEENQRFIKWMAGKIRVISLPDESMKRPRGVSWQDVLRECEREQNPPLVICDYIEEFARAFKRGSSDSNNSDANSAVMERLKDYACGTQGRVLAVASIKRSNYSGADNLFGNPTADPEDFQGIAKHSGYIDYAAAAILALQFSEEEQVFDEHGHPCKPMRLHLAMVREGTGPTTIKVLAYGGYCRFTEDQRAPDESMPDVGEYEKAILRYLAEPSSRQGRSLTQVRARVGGRPEKLKASLRQLAVDGHITNFRSGQTDLSIHSKWKPALVMDNEGADVIPLSEAKRKKDSGGSGNSSGSNNGRLH